MTKQARSKYTVIHLVLDSGERLPCLVEYETWLPVQVATRWVLRYRRYKVQSSTLAGNLQVIKRVYEWAHSVNLDIDDYLTSGSLLDPRQVESLVNYIRDHIVANSRDSSLSMFNPTLLVVEDFLKWCLYAENRGGVSLLALENTTAHRMQLELLFDTLRIHGRTSKRIQPLEEDEIEAIRQAIAPYQDKNGKWVFPAKGFSRPTALRNWLMFEVGLQLGLRRGEILKLRLDCLPRGARDGILVKRLPGDPNDSRTNEPAVKTAERIIPASKALLSAIRTYVTYPIPLGRVKGKTPYLFTGRAGQPISIEMSNDIIRAIGKHSGINSLSWHRLRHTWAERLAMELCNIPNGFDRLMYLGGWTNSNSPLRYIQGAIAKLAHQSMREYQASLYTDLEHKWKTR